MSIYCTVQVNSGVNCFQPFGIILQAISCKKAICTNKEQMDSICLRFFETKYISKDR